MHELGNHPPEPEFKSVETRAVNLLAEDRKIPPFKARLSFPESRVTTASRSA